MSTHDYPISPHKLTLRCTSSAKHCGWQLCAAVLLVLAVHWASMNLVAHRWIDCELAPTTVLQADPPSTKMLTCVELPDRWRRTAQGWECIDVDVNEVPHTLTPTSHFALSQIWPAAWAACVLLSIIGLARHDRVYPLVLGRLGPRDSRA